MEDALKARLIGASILVVLAVALLPELLSGPKTPASDASGAKGTRVITIDLGGAVEASRAPRPEADPARAEPTPALPTLGKPAATAAAPAETSGPGAEPADDARTGASSPAVTVPPTVAQAPAPAPTKAPATTTTTPSPTTPAPKPTVVAEPAPKPVAGSGKYSVQVGAFSSADGARRLVGDLKAAGFSAYVLAPAPGKKLHRVRVGPVADRAAADQLAAKLKSRGLPVAVTADG